MMRKLEIAELHSYKTYELDALLKRDGKELAVKILNLIVTIKPEDLSNSINLSNHELIKLILLHNVHNVEYGKKIIADYFTLQMLKLLSSGIYSRNRAIPKKIKQLFSDVFDKSSTTALKELIQCLGIIWEPAKADDFI